MGFLCSLLGVALNFIIHQMENDMLKLLSEYIY